MAKRGRTHRSYNSPGGRNERARAKGYESYYDYRAHDYGRIPPDQPRITGRALRRLRGHASAADLVREAMPGDLVVGSMGDRDAKGRFHQVDITVIHADGGESEYRLRGRTLDRAALLALVAELDEGDVIFSPAPSLDLRRMAGADRTPSIPEQLEDEDMIDDAREE